MTEDSDAAVKEDKESAAKSGSSGDRTRSSATKTSTNAVLSQKKDRIRDTPPTRVVIRHLPPTMTSEQFLEDIAPIPEHNDYYFCRSDQSLGVFAFCRAYINFVHMEDVFVFKDKFDGYVFIDTKGNEFPAIVEFAPYQRTARRRVGLNGETITSKRRDNKCGTIEEDPDFVQFLQELNEVKIEANMPSAEVYLEEIEARDKQLRANHGCLKMSTPLIEFIKNKRIEKNRLREERREERRLKQLEDQQKRAKLLKSKDDNRRHKEFDENPREKSNKKDDERVRIKPRDTKDYKDFDKSKSENKNNENVKTSEKTSSRRRDRNRSDRYKDKNSGHSSKDNNESTFVVKVVNNANAETKQQSNTSHANESKNESKTKNENEKSGDNGAQDVAKPRESKELTESKSNDTKTQRPETSTRTSGQSSRSDTRREDSRRIRNKDRPTREIYKPGSTTKRPDRAEGSQSQSNSDSHTSSRPKPSTSGSNPSGGYKQRVYTRSKP